MTKTTKYIGELGEKIAKNYYQKNQYQFLESNFRTKRGEIDLIFKHPSTKTIICTEVKTMSGHLGTSFSDKDHDVYKPEDKVDQLKINKIKHAIQVYIAKHPKFKDFDIRIDCISILIEFSDSLTLKDKESTKYLKNDQKYKKGSSKILKSKGILEIKPIPQKISIRRIENII